MEDYQKKACPKCGFVCIGPKSGSGGGCYLTTACVSARGLPDNCTELETLRQFRDQILMPTEYGRRAVATYYELAPAIVHSIERREDAKAVWEAVYLEIAEAVSLIRGGKYGHAFERYQRLARSLEAEYLRQD
jgi:hypothetical protein